MSTNHQTKENLLNQIKEIENNLKMSINTERNIRETRAIAAIKNNPKYFYKFVKNNSKIRAGNLSRMKRVTWNQATKR